MNRRACSGVHRCASAGFSGSSSIPAHGLNRIRRCLTAALIALDKVAYTRWRVAGEPGTAASTASTCPAFSRSSGRSPITGTMCTRTCDSYPRYVDAFLARRLPASQVSSHAATVMPVSPGSRFSPSRFRTVSVSGSGAPRFAA